jgi:hypothetical protein
MKKIAVFLIVVLACLTGRTAYAQYYHPDNLHRVRHSLVSETGVVLSDEEVLAGIGQEIYDETYVGAVKQYKASTALIWSGVGTTVVGAAGVAASAIFYRRLQDSKAAAGVGAPQSLKTQIVLTELGIGGASFVTIAGVSALLTGLVFRAISTQRLEWVAQDYNSTESRMVTARIGNGQYGTGLIINF